MLRCPGCNARINERVTCSRCSADLTALINSEQAAQQWFRKAVEYYLAANIEQSIAAIIISLNLNKTRIAVVFREFIIERQCHEILDLLAQKHLLAAKRSLYRVHFLFPYSRQLLHLNSFTDYLLANRPDCV